MKFISLLHSSIHVGSWFTHQAKLEKMPERLYVAEIQTAPLFSMSEKNDILSNISYMTLVWLQTCMLKSTSSIILISISLCTIQRSIVRLHPMFNLPSFFFCTRTALFSMYLQCTHLKLHAKDINLAWEWHVTQIEDGMPHVSDNLNDKYSTAMLVYFVQ